MTREEKLQFIAEMEKEDRDQMHADALKNYALYAERKGTLPPSGSDPESQARRDEWYRNNCPKGVWLQRR
jgi:hypothetical protein